MTSIWIALGLWGYAYVGYPMLLRLFASVRAPLTPHKSPDRWPLISIVIPAYNEAAAIADTLEAVLASDYPADRRQILVLSDGSTDGTDAIVANIRTRGVELLRMSVRGGKTAAENAARSTLRGEIIVNTDSSVRVHPAAVKHLIAAFADPGVGVASSRDVSVSHLDASSNPGEGAYVGYEMWVRGLETRVDGIIGASGSLYAIRADLHRHSLPDSLSRDFAAALVARKAGFRSVSVPTAICYVPRGVSFRREYARKVRTMTRGLGTLFFLRALLNPLKFGAFAWMLWSHKVCRWLLPWACAAAVLAVGVSAVRNSLGVPYLGLLVILGLPALIAWRRQEGASLPRLVMMMAYAAAGLAAGLHAWLRFLTGRLAPTWEPTRRGHAPAP